MPIYDYTCRKCGENDWDEIGDIQESQAEDFRKSIPRLIQLGIFVPRSKILVGSARKLLQEDENKRQRFSEIPQERQEEIQCTIEGLRLQNYAEYFFAVQVLTNDDRDKPR